LSLLGFKALMQVIGAKLRGPAGLGSLWVLASWSCLAAVMRRSGLGPSFATRGFVGIGLLRALSIPALAQVRFTCWFFPGQTTTSVPQEWASFAHHFSLHGSTSPVDRSHVLRCVACVMAGAHVVAGAIRQPSPVAQHPREAPQRHRGHMKPYSPYWRLPSQFATLCSTSPTWAWSPLVRPPSQK